MIDYSEKDPKKRPQHPFFDYPKLKPLNET